MGETWCGAAGHPMQWHIGRKLVWVAIGLVASSVVLAVAGIETASTTAKRTLLNWHESIGLSSLVVLLIALAVHSLDAHPPRRVMPRWLPGIRAAVEVSFYALLVVQPISGWLLASHEGKLASFFGWTLPPLAEPSNLLAHVGYVYHSIGSALIIIVAVLSMRLTLGAWVFSLLRRAKGTGRATRRARGAKSPDV